MNIAPTKTDVIKVDSDQLLMDQVLEPYFKHTKYLKSAVIEKDGDPDSGGRIAACCKFQIPVSCYIQNTGHFNSVEFNICYNQMMYYVIAKSVKNRLMNVFKCWELEDYFRKQLPDILIVNFKSTFRNPLQANNFYGEIYFMKTKVRKISKPAIYVKTICRFYDDSNGCCEGEVDLAVIS